MPESRTVNSAGERTVQITTTDAKKQRCTILLAITADGQKLPPHVLLKCKAMAKKFPQGERVLLQVLESGRMTED
jgi:hypothetical protein